MVFGFGQLRRITEVMNIILPCSFRYDSVTCMSYKTVWTLLSLAVSVNGQVRISEFLAANTQAHPDVVDFEDYPDWIELENLTAEAVSLDGWFLSDDGTRPYKWAFPAGATIPANGHLVVWADGHDTGPGVSHPRGYWPWRSFLTEGYHTNFSLSSDGEAVVLSRADGFTETPLIVAASPAPIEPSVASTWKYLDNGSNQSTQWRARIFDDSGWSSGVPEFGYGDGGEETVISFGASGSNKHITTYFRKTFQVADPSLLYGLRLKLMVDDGAVVYLNGQEVVRNNLPAGEIGYRTLAEDAIGGAAESAFTTYQLPATGLVSGDNVIAVEVHQSDVASSDVSFDLALDGLGFTSATLIDQTNYGIQVDDVSYGRDGSGDWVQFSNPTPGAVNGGGVVSDLRVSPSAVGFSLAGGFYTGVQTVELTAASGEIRYTLDGSLPRVDSPLYSVPLEITATTVLRARVFEAGKANSLPETRTYFIGETPGTVPYVSVVADPEVLFGDEIGIYYNESEPLVSSTSNAALGLRDVYKGKDAPGSLEYFEADGEGAFQVNGGLRMGGENNWVHGQRAMNFAIRGKYGDDEIKYDLFPGTGVSSHTGITLRDGGDAWAKEMLRDGMWHFIAKGQMKVDTSAYQPSVMFINGEYWGIHNLRSRWDDNWFFRHKLLNSDDVDHLLYGHVTSTATTLGVEKGDAASWNDLLAFMTANSMAVAENYAFVEERLDIDSFIDFVVCESWGINTSWGHNREFWRSRKPGGKWQWFIPDMDQTFRASQVSTSVFNSMLGSDQVLVRLKANTKFKNRLAQRFAAHVGSTFKPARINALIDMMADQVAAEVPRHVARWSAWGGMTATTRATEIQGMRDFTASRDANVLGDVRTRLALANSVVNVALGMSVPEGGRILINGVAVEPGNIRLFPNIPFDLKAEAAPGYQFDSWTGAGGGAETQLTITGATSLTANFVASGETVIGGTLAADETLTSAGSPYVLDEDLIVPPNVILTVGEGVEIRMAEGTNVRVQGAFLVQGTLTEPVRIEGRNGERWGAISFENPTGASELTHLVIRGATQGFDPLKYPYAISGLNAELVLEWVDIDECQGPIFARGGSTILRNSRLHTPYTGDCINVKGGYAETWDTVFIGSSEPDTDAIDYDGVVNGIISGNRIYRFTGPNCDGIDVGEECVNVLIENNLIYFSSDKGVSVGQGSTVVMRKNLVVGCALGVGVKDAGSSVLIDQNTFAGCELGVDVYEKNFGSGGGAAVVTNTILSGCGFLPVRVDGLSSLEVSYSLSDTIPLVGTGNLLMDPMFVDALALNYQLQPGSPAIHAGDPGHPLDPDGTIVDIGARYVYDAGHYPYAIEETVVIDEVYANSGAGAADWIELFNRSSTAMDIGGWFLSDSRFDLQRYRIAPGTVIPAGGRLVFYEDIHFGDESLDPGRITPFALSDLGETIYLSSAEDDLLTDYRSQEDFGASLEGVALGNYYKPSTATWNFVAQKSPTPGLPNSGPRVGPIVISEVHYAPSGNTDSEFFELLNVSGAPVTLYDAGRVSAWRITNGIDFEFPSAVPVVMEAGERIVLTRSLTRFNEAFTVPEGTRVFEWTTGRLANEGETLQIGQPGGVDEFNVRQFVRADRVAYDRLAPWPAGTSVTGLSLTKIAEGEYGNDAANWRAAVPSPGSAGPEELFASWIVTAGAPEGLRGPDDDSDGDGVPNLIEYAIGGNPMGADVGGPFGFVVGDDSVDLSFKLRLDRPGVSVRLRWSPDLSPGSWVVLDTVPLLPLDGYQERRVLVPRIGERGFYDMIAE